MCPWAHLGTQPEPVTSKCICDTLDLQRRPGLMSTPVPPPLQKHSSHSKKLFNKNVVSSHQGGYDNRQRQRGRSRGGYWQQQLQRSYSRSRSRSRSYSRSVSRSRSRSRGRSRSPSRNRSRSRSRSRTRRGSYDGQRRSRSPQVSDPSTHTSLFAFQFNADLVCYNVFGDPMFCQRLIDGSEMAFSPFVKRPIILLNIPYLNCKK